MDGPGTHKRRATIRKRSDRNNSCVLKGASFEDHQFVRGIEAADQL